LDDREPGVPVRASAQGGRKAYLERRLSAATSRPSGPGRLDPSDLVARRVVVKENSGISTLTLMLTQQDYVGRRSGPADRAAMTAVEAEPTLSVVVIYHDSLTRYWAADLWGRVGKLIDSGGISRKSWKLSELADSFVYADAVRAAAVADMLVISVRDAGDMPLLLPTWVDDWLPLRAGRAGALVALIGVPARPDAQAGRIHTYLEAIARQAGLDFLPRERRLPEESLARSTLPRMAATTNATATEVPAGFRPSISITPRFDAGFIDLRLFPKCRHVM
jgi:hypothetical protein